MTRLRHYVAKHQDSCDIFFQPLKYASSTPPNQSTGFSTFRSVHPLEIKTFYYPSKNTSELSGKIPPCLLRSSILLRLDFLREKINSRLTAVQKRNKCNYCTLVRKTLVLKTKELNFDRSPLVTNTNNWERTSKPTCNTFMRRAHGFNRIITFQHHLMAGDEFE